MPENQSYHLIALSALCDAADEVTRPPEESDADAVAQHFETALRYLADSLDVTSPAVRSQRDRARDAADKLGRALDAARSRAASASIGPTDVLCETIDGDPATRITLANEVRVF